MIKIGIRAHDIGKMNPIDLSQHVKDYGFQGVQLVFKKAINHEVDFNQLSEIKKAFSDQIMMLGAYFNPVHPDREQVKSGVHNFKKHLDIANELHADFVGSETGSLMGSPWGYVKENHEQKTLDEVVEIFKDLTKHAENKNAYIAIEGAYAHVAYSPEKIKYIVDQINSPHLKVTIDLFNFLHIGNYEQRNKIFKQSIELLKDDIVIFHLKDFIINDQKLVQVGLGQGLMDYPYLIKEIKKHFSNVYLIFEGVIGDDIKTSYEYINHLLKGDSK